MTRNIKHLVAIGAISIITLGATVPSSAQTIDNKTTYAKYDANCIVENTKKQIRCSVKNIILSGKVCGSIVIIPGNICGNDSEKPEIKPDEKPSIPGDSNDNTTTKPDVKPDEKPSEPGDSNDNTTTKPDEKPNVEPDEKPEVPDSSNDFSKFQQRVLELVNTERAKVGASALTLNSKLSNVATIKSQDMINKNYFDHNSPTYGSPFDMMNQFGISYQSAGENIAMGQTTPEEVMNAWMNSSGHRKNILNPSFTELGVGIAENSNGQLYWTQMFIGN